MGEERNMYRVLIGKPEGKRTLERPRRGWDEGIRMDLREIGLRSVDWIQLAQDRDRWRALVNTVMNLRVLVPRSYLVIHISLKINVPNTNNSPHPTKGPTAPPWGRPTIWEPLG
jgi:hypothetical protein